MTAIRAAAAAAVLALIPLAAHGQDVTPPSESAATQSSATSGPAEDATGASYRISAGTAHQFSTDFEDDDGQFSMTRYGLSAGVSYPFSNVLIDHSLTYEYDDYNFDGFMVPSGGGLREDSPFEDSHLLSYSLGLSHRLDDEWSIFGGPMVGVMAESGADWSDAITVGATAGVRKQFSPDLALGLGVIATSGIEEGATVLPLILVDWHISQRLSVRNGRPQPGLRGTAGAELAYELTPAWTVAAGFAYDRRRFRLDDDSLASNGVAENSSFPVYVRAAYEFNKRWSVGAMAGLLMGGQMRIEDEDGHKVAESDYDTAPFVGISAACNF